MADIKDPENTLLMETSKGRVTIELRPDLAPGHVARIKELARQGFYDGVKFHRVIDGFMAQTGDPNSKAGSASSGEPAALARSSRRSFRRRSMCAARSRWRARSDPNSGDSQFFICFDEAPHLNKQYTVWGRVTEGMENIDAINKGEPPKKS